MDGKTPTQEQRENAAGHAMAEHYNAMLRSAAMSEMHPGKFLDIQLRFIAQTFIGTGLSMTDEQVGTALTATIKDLRSKLKQTKPSLTLVTE